ncbi:MAG: SseB family protein [Pseudomonadota bacterium]
MTGATTALDDAWATTEAPGAGDAEMARFYDVFAATELHLLIDPASMEGDATPQPLLFPVEGTDTALVFDTEDRMASFMEDGAAHLTLSGRAVVGMFAGRGVQIGVNLGDAPSATVLPTAAVDWAAEALRQPIEAAEANAAEMTLTVPRGVLPDLMMRLDGKLSAMSAAVAEAWLCGLGSGRRAGLILCVSLRTPRAEQAVVSALAETARFAGGDRAAFDIAVLTRDDPRLVAARKVGLGFEPADPEEAERRAAAPDPTQPPKFT